MVDIPGDQDQPPVVPPAPAGQATARNPAKAGSRWVAIVTGAISILIGVLYLLLITVLDSRGPLRPPPPEALGYVQSDGAASAPGGAAAVPPPG